jgi:hypothetical protein
MKDETCQQAKQQTKQRDKTKEKRNTTPAQTDVNTQPTNKEHEHHYKTMHSFTPSWWRVPSNANRKKKGGSVYNTNEPAK